MSTERPGLEFSEAVIDNGEYGRHTIRFEFDILAQQAGGSAAIYSNGDTMLLAVTTAAKTPWDAIDFSPLIVDIEERMYAVGRTPGSFFRRGGRPGGGAILATRLIDRLLRPVFVKGLCNEIQVIVDVLSLNPAHYYDVAAISAASMATTLAGLPSSGPTGGVYVALIDETWVCFPTVEQVIRSSFRMVVAGYVLSDGDVAIMMVGVGGTESTWENVRSGRTAPTEEVVGRGLEVAKPFIKTLCDAQSELKAKLPKETFDFPVFRDHEDDIYVAVEELTTDWVSEAMRIPGKQDRDDATHAIHQDITEALAERFEGRGSGIAAALKSLTKKIVRYRTLTEGVHIDGQGMRDIRTLSAEATVILRVHGSALFQRGETQILGVSTLNILDMEQKIDTLPPESTKRYMYNYNFPLFSTGETGRVGSPKRRETGRGALAERIIIPVLPIREEFPYAIRQVSEAIGPNGPISMGSARAPTPALLNAGVLLKTPVAGIAMGLTSEEIDGETRYVALTDTLGVEDALGDMDFKMAGTRDFVAAPQFDTKLNGIPAVELQKALLQVCEARHAPLEVMGEAIDIPDEMSPYAPWTITLCIPVDKIGEVIGPKGRVINQIQDDTGANITIGDDGTICVGAEIGETSEVAASAINAIVNPHILEKGEHFIGTVVKITTFGAFVSLLPGKDGLLHISKLRALVGGKRVEDVEDVVSAGQELQVEISEIDDRGKLSLIPVLEEEAEADEV